jgi:hypothetical protein
MAETSRNRRAVWVTLVTNAAVPNGGADPHPIVALVVDNTDDFAPHPLAALANALRGPMVRSFCGVPLLLPQLDAEPRPG